MSRLTFITLFSLVALVLASLVHWQDELLEEPVSHQRPADETDFFMVNATTTQFSTNGEVNHRLKANQITHYPNGEFTVATTPKITLLHQDGTAWHIDAKHGRIGENNNIIKLWDNVNLLRDTPPNELKINTSELTFNAVKKIAHTQQDVVIIDDSTRIDATGMITDINENRTKLLSNVRVTHDPAKVN